MGSSANLQFEKMTIGDRIRYLREIKEVKQVDLAKRIGLSQAAISNLETDSSRKPSAPTLMKLAAALECNPDWILNGKGDPFTWAPITKEAEVELLKLYKHMTPAARQAILAAARAMMNDGE